MDPVHTAMGALVAGLVTSVHCVGMCGPIACGLSVMSGGESARMIALTAYHASRLTSYTVIGGICAAIGEQPLRWVFGSPAVLLPWILVAVFLALAFGLDKRLPKPALLVKFGARWRFRAARMTPLKSGLALGSLTPLLPCGPLYLLFGAAMLTGSPIRGAEFALAFGLGTVPLPWLAQRQMSRWRRSFSPPTMVRVQRTLALVTALVLAWRLHGTLPVFQDRTAEAEALPACCH